MCWWLARVCTSGELQACFLCRRFKSAAKRQTPKIHGLAPSDLRCAVQRSERACATQTPPRVVVARFIPARHMSRRPWGRWVAIAPTGCVGCFSFVCLWPGCIGDLWRMVPCFCHWSTLAIRVGGRVACPVVVFAITSGTWFSALVIDLHLWFRLGRVSGGFVCDFKWFMVLGSCR